MKRYWFLIPILLAILVRAPLISPVFVYDDVALVAEHPHLDEPGFAREIFRRDYGLEFSGSEAGYYRPALMLINVGLCRAVGRVPYAYHAFSLAVFCLTLVLLMTAARLGFPEYGKGVAFAVGCLYAVHPARTETIGLFATLPDQLIELLALGAVMLLVSSLHNTGTMPPRQLAWKSMLAGAIGLCAGLTKESAFFVLSAIAATAVVLGLVKRQRAIGLHGFAVAIGLGVASGTRMWAHIESQQDLSAYAKALLSNGAGTAFFGLLRGLLDLAIPRPVQVRYLMEGPEGGLWVLPLLILAAFLLGVWWWLCIKKAGGTAALLVAWVGASALNLAMIFAAHVAYSERYLPVIPAVVAIGVAAAALSRWIVNPKALLPRACALVYVLGFAWFAFQGALAFRSEMQFFSHLAVHAAPQDPTPHVALAMMADKHGDLDGMEHHIATAAALDPQHMGVRDIKTVFARKLLTDNQSARALAFLDIAVAEHPDNVDNLALKAVALAKIGQLEAGYAWIEKAVQREPSNTVYQVLSKQIERDMKASR